jgi:hypothetical protein
MLLRVRMDGRRHAAAGDAEATFCFFRDARQLCPGAFSADPPEQIHMSPINSTSGTSTISGALTNVATLVAGDGGVGQRPATTASAQARSTPTDDDAAAEAAAVSHGGCRLFVGGLADSVATEDLRAYFQQFGAVTSATVLQCVGSLHLRSIVCWYVVAWCWRRAHASTLVRGTFDCRLILRSFSFVVVRYFLCCSHNY